jgi:uncharacterized protein YndB with AHSA1/START domain
LIEITKQHTITASVSRVWAVIADARRLPDWYGRAQKVEVLEGDGLGRRQRVSSQWNGQQSEVDQLVTVFEPERRLEWRHTAERLNGQPAPRFAAETVLRMELEPRTPDSTLVTLSSRQQAVDPEKEAAMRGNSAYLGQMFEASLARLEQLLGRS